MEYPLISCIMPTTGSRKRFVERSIAYFNQQDYPNKELIIVDEHDAYGDCADVVPSYVHYVWMLSDRKMTIGMKRNIACSLAQGEIICLWDDDDWYGADRLSRQIEPLKNGRADMSALRMSLLLEVQDGTLWKCSDRMHRWLFAMNVRAGTLMYKAQVWHEGLHYWNSSAGEDTRFLYGLLARPDVHLAPLDGTGCYICVRHEGNVSPLITRGDASEDWQQVPIEQYLSEEDRAFYRQFASERSSC